MSSRIRPRHNRSSAAAPSGVARTSSQGSLERYSAMRDFRRTNEPLGKVGRSESGFSFVVQKHAARRLHYDFRLEWGGVLLSWAVPKGPSLSPRDKRLAVRTEDHPIDYRDFEGTIPEGEYGAGPVIVWDRGTWTPIGDPAVGLEKGRLDFELHGTKLKGAFVLVRTRASENKSTWLLIKRNDAWAESSTGPSIVERSPESVLTGRSIEDVLAGVAPVPLGTTEEAKRRTDRKKPRSEAPNDETATKLPPFGSIAPELATLVKTVPASGPWIYEIKFDGYRTMAWLDRGEVKLASRRGLDWTEKYPAIASALSHVRARTAIFDGEVAYVRDDGRTSFQGLQNALSSRSAAEQGRLVYFIFDLLFYDGADLRDEPLANRKARLRTILAGEPPPLRLSDHLDDGHTFFREACKLGLEGIIGKRADKPYRSRRTTEWIKLKCHAEQEVVIVGYTPMKGSRGAVGALLVGVHDDEGLRYAGKVGTGFSNATLRDLAARLRPIEIDRPAVRNPPRSREVRWVKPELVAQVRFSEWTSDGIMRHPSFEGLRLDKPAREVRLESPRDRPPAPAPDPLDTKPRALGIVISHPTRAPTARAPRGRRVR